MAIYAVCPDLRVVQDYTSDPERLLSSLDAFVFPRASSAASVESMLAALREIAGRMSGSSGRKSIVWMSQGYGAELSSAAVRNATDATVAALNDVNVPLYAVDARFNPTCRDPLPDMTPNQSRVVTGSRVCSQPADASDDWMKNLAQATGGRAFTISHIDAFRTEVRNVQGRMIWGEIRYLYKFSGRGSAIDEALASRLTIRATPTSSAFMFRSRNWTASFIRWPSHSRANRSMGCAIAVDTPHPPASIPATILRARRIPTRSVSMPLSTSQRLNMNCVFLWRSIPRR